MLERKQIVLIGFKGVGKTTLGKQIAERTSRKFLDTDHWIETETGKSPRECYREEGHDAFRELEREAVLALAGEPNSLLATGGSTPMDPTCRELLQRGSFLIHLYEEPELVRERLFHQELPPFLNPKEPHKHFDELFAQRTELFDQISHFQCKADLLWQAIDLVSSSRSPLGGSRMVLR